MTLELTTSKYKKGWDCLRCGHRRGEDSYGCYVYGKYYGGRHLYEAVSEERSDESSAQSIKGKGN